eukprot:6242491-Pyramimonas_sp.AAC.1
MLKSSTNSFSGMAGCSCANPSTTGKMANLRHLVPPLLPAMAAENVVTECTDATPRNESKRVAVYIEIRSFKSCNRN